MRTVTYGAACSLDGFIARADNGVEWLQMTRDAQAVMERFWPTIDTILFGRRSWEFAMQSGASGGASGGITSYVFSRTLKPTDVTGAELVSENAGAFVADLKRREGKGICVMSGGDLAASLLAAGVVDQIGLNIHPILLGAGVPMFRSSGAGDVQLELAECREMSGGCVLVNYRVKKPRTT